MYQIFGFVGTLLFILAYIPQVIHLMKHRRTEGVSLHSWVMWSVATILVLLHAMSGSDPIYQLFSLANFFFIVSITLLLVVYQKTSSVALPFKKKKSLRV